MLDFFFKWFQRPKPMEMKADIQPFVRVEGVSGGTPVISSLVDGVAGLNKAHVDTNAGLLVSPTTWQLNLASGGSVSGTGGFGTLGSGAIYTSATMDRTVLGEKHVTVSTLVAGIGSASTGLVIQGSDDNTNWYTYNGGGLTVFTGSVAIFDAALTFRYWRVQYTNGAGTQTSMAQYAMCASVDSLPTCSRGNTPGSGGSVVPVQGASGGYPLPANVTQISGATMGAPVAAGSSATGNILAVQGVASGTNINAAVIGQSPAAATTGTIAAAGSASAISATVSNAGNVTISAHGTYVAALTFEASDDSGTTWYPFTMTRGDNTGNEQVTPTMTNLSRLWDSPAPGITNIRVWASTYTSGTVNIRISQGGLIYDPGTVATIVPYRRTFRAATTGLVSGSATALAEFAGNATTIVKISRIVITGTAATGGVVDFTLQLRSTAASSGTSANMTVVKADSSDGTANSSTPKGWTVTGGTLGTLVGNLWAERWLVPTAAATGPAAGRISIDMFDMPFGKPITLIGTAQILDVVWTGTLTTPTFDIMFEWTEET